MASAEEFAQPSYKWIGERRLVRNLQGWRISLYPGGIGFSVSGCPTKRRFASASRVEGRTERPSSTLRRLLCGRMGRGLPEMADPPHADLPLRGAARPRARSDLLLQRAEGQIVIPSRYMYRFATLEDFYRGRLSLDDFDDPLSRGRTTSPFRVGRRTLRRRTSA